MMRYYEANAPNIGTANACVRAVYIAILHPDDYTCRRPCADLIFVIGSRRGIIGFRL